MATALAAAVLSPEHARRAIDSCDLNTAVGLRDRTVLLLLARLGLRAHEIIALQLEDCDWDSGHLRLCSKGRRQRLLPMPTDVGAAIAAYLQPGAAREDGPTSILCYRGRRSAERPKQGAIGTIVRCALQRARVDAPHRGSHQFRHALAVRMLRGGASFARDRRSPAPSKPTKPLSIYARVDIGALRSLAHAVAGRCVMNTLREAWKSASPCVEVLGLQDARGRSCAAAVRQRSWRSVAGAAHHGTACPGVGASGRRRCSLPNGRGNSASYEALLATVALRSTHRGPVAGALAVCIDASTTLPVHRARSAGLIGGGAATTVRAFRAATVFATLALRSAWAFAASPHCR